MAGGGGRCNTAMSINSALRSTIADYSRVSHLTSFPSFSVSSCFRGCTKEDHHFLSCAVFAPQKYTLNLAYVIISNIQEFLILLILSLVTTTAFKNKIGVDVDVIGYFEDPLCFGTYTTIHYLRYILLSVVIQIY